MKISLAGFSAAAALALAGCSTTDTGTVSYNNQGVRVYGLESQPQANISGTGSLMPGAYSNGPEMNHGRFSGQERTMTGVGQRPTVAPNEDSREYARGEEPATKLSSSATLAGGGAGTLGQAGVTPDNTTPPRTILVTPATAAVSALTTSGAEASGSAPTLNSPLTAGGGAVDVGRPGTTETGIGTSIDDPGSSVASGNDANLGPLDQSISPRDTLNTDLSNRVRDALTTGRPGAITTLTPDRLGQVKIEAQNGNVTLRGTANSETEKLLLGQRVRRLPGVSSVNNQLRVVSPTRTEMNDATDPARRANPLDQFDKRPAQAPQQ
ncbi:MAG: BON domain-containing protein [Verrucomicrobiales bacterium]